MELRKEIKELKQTTGSILPTTSSEKEDHGSWTTGEKHRNAEDSSKAVVSQIANVQTDSIQSFRLGLNQTAGKPRPY
ncbi:hypothetical protein FQR65_LT06619 [Abscondita terminalis]|nr:hypothetical protein FQR65_LT06619 [Abscondita terminalis]